MGMGVHCMTEELLFKEHYVLNICAYIICWVICRSYLPNDSLYFYFGQISAPSSPLNTYNFFFWQQFRSLMGTFYLSLFVIIFLSHCSWKMFLFLINLYALCKCCRLSTKINHDYQMDKCLIILFLCYYFSTNNI